MTSGMDTVTTLRSLGQYSRYQLQAYLLISVSINFPYAWTLLSFVFIGDAPNYRCKIGVNDTVNASIPTVTVDGVETFSQCSMYKEPGVSNETVPCQNGFWYDPESGYDSTLVTEFDLTCEKSWLVELSITIMNIGYTLAAFTCTRFSDRFGRKKVLLTSLWSWMVILVLHAFSTSIYMFLAIELLVGAALEALFSSGYIMSLELFSTDQRTFAGMAGQIVWGIACTLVVPIAYFIRNWRHLLLCISLPFVLGISLYWLIPESIPWLIANKRYEAARVLLTKAHKMNKTKLPDCLSEEKSDSGKEMGQNDRTDKRLSAVDIFKSSRLRAHSLVLMLLWFDAGLVYTAISLTVTYLPGDRYLNSVIYGLLEIPAFVLCWVLVRKIGRVKPLCAYTVTSGIALFGTAITSLDCCTGMWQLSLAFSMLVKFCITSTFAAMILFTGELYPTNVRTAGYGLCSSAAYIASYISPFTRLLYRRIPWLSPVIFGILCIISGLMTLLLPETRHASLPETMKESESLGNTTTKKKSAERVKMNRV